MKAIEAKNLTVEIDGKVLLEDITFDVEESSLVTVFGPNGAGKSTLLKTILGQLSVSSGSLKLFGHYPKQARQWIGYVPQNIEVDSRFPLSVFDSVMMGRYGKIGLGRSPRESDKIIINSILEELGIVAWSQHQVSKLSGGELQRVFLARALASEPKLLLLDEASSAADPSVKDSIFTLFSRLKKKMALLFVTHDLSVVSNEVDLVLCLNKTLISHGRPDAALSEDALRKMYGSEVSYFSHCHGDHSDKAHVHVKSHGD